MGKPSPSSFNTIANLGGAGAPYDVTVSSGNLGVSDNDMVIYTATSAWLALVNTFVNASYRLFTVINPTYTNGRVFMGDAARAGVQMSSNATHWRLQVRQLINGSNINSTGVLIPQVAGKRWLIELEFAPNYCRHFIDGVVNIETTPNWNNLGFPLQYIGRGNSGTPNEGTIGDTLVLLQGGNYNANIDKVRAYLRAKHNIT